MEIVIGIFFLAILAGMFLVGVAIVLFKLKRRRKH